MLTDAIKIPQCRLTPMLRVRWAGAVTLFSGVLLAISLHTTALAASKDGPSTYHVEVLLFASNDPAAPATESWPEIYETGDRGQFLYVTHPETAEATAPASKETVKKKSAVLPYQLLPREQFKLAASFAKQKKNPNYDVLLHAAWRQLAIDLKDETAVYIFDGMTEREHPVEPLAVSSAASPVIPTPPPAAVLSSNGATVNPDPRAPRFSGTVKLALGQYLHVDLDLFFRKEMRRTGSTDANGNETLTAHNALQSFRLNEIRRIKIGEVHYFDHPVFGALVLIASVEKPKAIDVEKETVGADSPVPQVPDN